MSDVSPLPTRGSWTPEAIRAALKLYAVTDSAWLDGRTLTSCVEEALQGGATFVQLRDKDASTAALVLWAHTLMPLCKEAGVPFVIDDDVEAVKAAGADGIHIGQDDADCAEVRKELGPDAIIGVSVQSVPMALAAQAAGADYVGVGAVAATSTKEEAGVLTPEEIRAIADAIDIPVVAIGGINESTLPLLEGTHVAGVAVVSAIFAAKDIKLATSQLKKAVDVTPFE